MQKHRIKSLYCNRQAREKKADLSLFSREAIEPTSKRSEEIQRWRAEGTQILYSDWLEYMVWQQIVIVLSLIIIIIIINTAI